VPATSVPTPRSKVVPIITLYRFSSCSQAPENLEAPSFRSVFNFRDDFFAQREEEEESTRIEYTHSLFIPSLCFLTTKFPKKFSYF